MNGQVLLERAKFRRRLAVMAMQQFAAKREMTPQEVQKALQKTDKLQSIFGAPKGADGKPIGKAGRTIALMEKWLKAKDKFDLPPIGEQFKTFVTEELDSSNYIWGHEEAVRDLSRDIQYNFGFDPDQVSLVEEKEKETKKVPNQTVNLSHMAPMVQPLQGPLNMNAQLKNFTKKGQYAYRPAEVKDHTVLPETPVVTRVDYEEDIEKAKQASEFGKEPEWTFNNRNVAQNNLLEDKSAEELNKKEPSVSSEEKKQFDDYHKPDRLYPIRGFVKKSKVRKFAQTVSDSKATKIFQVLVGTYTPSVEEGDKGWDILTIYIVGNNPRLALRNYFDETLVSKFEIHLIREIFGLPQQRGLLNYFAIDQGGKIIPSNKSLLGFVVNQKKK